MKNFLAFRCNALPYIVAMALAGVIITSCSTKKNTVVSRNFHKLTAHYNYYFNARESYQRGEKRAKESIKYNYTQTLPILLSGDKQTVGIVSGDMDRAITKCTNLITRHSITAKPERKRGAQTAKDKEFYALNEYNKWAVDAWLLIGKSQVWKGALPEATRTLEHILLQFPNTHNWFEAQVWLARVSLLSNDLIAANDKLSTIESNRKRPKDEAFTHLLQATRADFFLKNGQVNDAISSLEKCLAVAKKKDDKLRYTFILAQLHHQQGNKGQASELYARVVRMNPPYEMSFNAKINLAQNFRAAGDAEKMRKDLVKMSKDDKNRDYLDQIYYALGNIERSQNNMSKAIEYYELSAKSSVENESQKGVSYLTLADYYFTKPAYEKAQAYYDSAFNALDETHPEYIKLDAKTRYLTRLVESLNTIAREDSLQRVAKMSSSDRDALIANLIKQVQADEEKQRLAEQEDRDRAIQYQQNQRYQNNPANEGGKWYFYNQATLSYGQSEFQMKWGRRKLEDNWRRKNKRVVLTETNATAQVTDSVANPEKLLSNKTKEFYLVNLPTNDSLVKISNSRIVEAMLKVGEVYQNDLKDYPASIKAYQNLANRFTNTDYALQAYYNLYQIALFANNTTDAAKYKGIIVSSYPNSQYAQMLSNPNYLKELQQKQKESDRLYQEAYGYYSKNQFAMAQSKAEEGLRLYKGTAIESKFALIKALCQGKTADTRTFREALQGIGRQYPNSEEKLVADNVLAYLQQQELKIAMGQVETDTPKETETDTPKAAIEYALPKGEHLFIALVPKEQNINQLKFNLITFNVDFFIDADLTVNNEPFNDFFIMISVTSFKSDKEAMEYYRLASGSEGLMGTMKPSDYVLLVISKENLELFKSDKSIADYLNFFQNNYR
ncbi:MAG: tetratricopeptide repeat protein [Bacteroidales bacterium]|nr:tetratricopeptide repeat protein [Bacteroidales bacterium]MBN2749384.1 tetratricopeptide repeat protein [Bacteroidales bacterium]